MVSAIQGSSGSFDEELLRRDALLTGVAEAARQLLAIADFDTAVNGWLMEAGLLEFGAEHAFIVAETGCRYHGDIMFPDVVHVGLKVAKLGGSSVVWNIGLFRNDADIASADGLFVHVHVKREGHKPTPMPADVRTVLEPLVR